MSMFCYQCQETVGGKGCTVRGVCGKTEEVAKLQDLLVYTVKEIAELVVKTGIDVSSLAEINREVLKSLFMTITNANFDDGAIEAQIRRMLSLRDGSARGAPEENLHDAAASHGFRELF
jgi:hydroxylamine reductase